MARRARGAHADGIAVCWSALWRFGPERGSSPAASRAHRPARPEDRMSLTPHSPPPPTHEMLAAVTDGRTDEMRLRGLEATLRRRDAVLAAVCYAASHFLTTEDWERDVQELLSRLGEAADVHHVYLFEGYR